MKVSDKDAQKLYCPFSMHFESCLGSECMAWQWAEDTWRCQSCGAVFPAIGDAEACHGIAAQRIATGTCGRLSNG
jgi:hypothetical protein